MTKKKKILLVLAASPFILGVLFVFGFKLFFDPNDYKDKIVQVVKQKTGRTLVLTGDIDVSLIPKVAVSLGPVTLSNPPGFEGPTFLSAERVSVKLSTMALLRKQVEIDGVEIKGATVNLVKDENGRANWAEWSPEPGQAPEPSPTAEEKPAPEASQKLRDLNIGPIEIADTTINFQDKAAGTSYALIGLNLETDEFAPGSKFGLSLDTRLASIKPELEGDLKIKGHAVIGPKGRVIDASGLNLDMNLNGPNLPEGRVRASLSADAALDLNRQTLDIANLAAQVFEMQLTGQAKGSAILSEPRFTGRLDLAEFNPRATLSRLGADIPEPSDPSALTRAKGSLSFDATAGSANISDLKLSLDQTELAGFVNVRSFSGPDVAFDLDLNEIDLNRYLPAKKEGEKTGAAAEKPKPGKDQGESMIKTVVLNGEFTAGRLAVHKIQARDIEVKVVGQNGVFRFDPLNALMYEGSIQGSAVADLSGQAPKISVSESVSGLAVGELLRDLAGTDKLSGKTDLKMNLSFSASDAKTVIRTLTGDASLNLTQGLLRGVGLPLSKNPEHILISQARGGFNFKNGVVRNNDFYIANDQMKANGRGVIDLPNQSLDYELRVNPANLPVFPVRLAGSLKKPDIHMQKTAFVTENVESLGQGLGEVVTGAPGKVGETLKDTPEKLQDTMEGLGESFKGILR